MEKEKISQKTWFTDFLALAVVAFLEVTFFAWLSVVAFDDWPAESVLSSGSKKALTKLITTWGEIYWKRGSICDKTCKSKLERKSIEKSQRLSGTGYVQRSNSRSVDFKLWRKIYTRRGKLCCETSEIRASI